MKERDCKTGLICAIGESQHLTFLWEGPQDTSFIESLKNALESLKNALFEKLDVAVLCTMNLNIANTSRTSISLGPQGMMTAGSLGLWFLQDSGELR